MLSFSKISNNYVHKRDIQVASMAQYCDTDRSTMYKYLSGKRTPPSHEIVERMADFMKLTPVEKKELVEAYRVAYIGADKYFHRKNVISFFINYPSDTFDSDIFPTCSFGEESACTGALFAQPTEAVVPLQNKIDIQQVLYHMLLRESLRPDGLIRIIAQPSWSYLFDLLQSIGTQNSQYQIQHIICMDNSRKADYKNTDYNIAYLHSIMSVYQSDALYRPRYYYDNVDSHFNNLNLFPYLVLTSEYALTCSSDIHTAILYQDKQTLDMYHTLFEQQYSQTSPLFNKASDNALEYMQISQSQITDLDTSYQLSACPCLLSLGDRYLYEKCVIDMPDREVLISNLVSYSLFLEDVQHQGLLKTRFTKKGVNYLLKTGRFPDIPPSFYHPLGTEDLKYLLKRLYDRVDAGEAQMLSGIMENLSLGIECLFNSTTGTMITTGKNHKINYLVLEERNLINAFTDCLSHLSDMDIVASREETMKYLDSVLGTI